jgi:CubicO group peptidase (beta-lactamase class C family)
VLVVEGEDGRVDEPRPPERWRQILESAVGNGAFVVAFTCDGTGDGYWCAGRLAGLGAVGPATPGYGASIAKQMMGVLAARAVVEGGLSPEAPVRQYLPGLPGWVDPVRVRHLLHHTAGLPQPPTLARALGLSADFAGWSRLDNAAILAALREVGGPTDAPGMRFSYDNTGYVLLAEVLAAVRGSVVSELARTDLFHPLGMSESRLGGAAASLLPAVDPPPRTVGDGGLWTSGQDLLRWLKALNRDAFGADVSALVQTVGRLDDGTLLDYAWGTAPRPGPMGTTSYIHGGSWPGWAVMTVRNPSAGTAVAVLAAAGDAQLVSSLTLDLHTQMLSHQA